MCLRNDDGNSLDYQQKKPSHSALKKKPAVILDLH